MSKAKASVPAWRQKAAAVLERARCRNAQQAFAVAEHLHGLPFDVATSIQVTGLPGHLQLPITEQQLSSLLSLGEPAPFGLGTETVLDPAVRKATQIEAARVQTNDIWQQQMQQLTARAAKGLGVDEHVHVEAHPYKLLIYTEGGHFKAHRDTEKEPGMFGTLVVQLPVTGGHVGGEFVFRHNGKTIRCATEEHSSSQFQYAAFYADVEHELQPITSGTRVVLVYSLVRTGTSLTPKPVDASPLIKEMRAAVASWEQDLTARGSSRLFVPLAHRYTEASLSFESLKGRDANIVSCLTHPDVGLEVHVALAVKTKSYTDCDPYTADPTRIEHAAKGCVSALGAKPGCKVIEHLSWPQDAWVAGNLLEPSSRSDDNKNAAADIKGDGPADPDLTAGRKEDELRDVNYTGNECSTQEKIYRQAVLIIWPRSRTDALVGTDNFMSALYLLELRLLSGTAAEVRSAVKLVMRLHQKTCDKWKHEYGTSTNTEYGWGRQPINKQDVAMALMVISKAPRILAIPAMQTIIQELVELGPNLIQRHHYETQIKLDDNWHWNDQTEGQDIYEYELCPALVGSLVAVGTPDVLVTSLLGKVKALAIKATVACVRLAVEAADKSASLSSRIAEMVLSQTVFTSDAAQVLGSLPDEHVCGLAIMLCEIPAQRTHLEAFAAVVASLPVKPKEVYPYDHYYPQPEDLEPRSVLKVILKNAQVKAAAFHTPSAVATMATAYQQLLKEKLKPVSEFSWEMPGADLPDFPDVQAFFHGPEMSATFSDCFKDGEVARTLLRDLSCWCGYADTFNGKTVMAGELSAHVTASGLSGVPVVTITKTEEYYKEMLPTNKARNEKIYKLLKPVDDLLRLCSQIMTAAATVSV